MAQSQEDRRRGLMRLAVDDPAALVDIYIAEGELVDQLTGERDRARDLAVREGVFDGVSNPVAAPVRVSKANSVLRWDCGWCGTTTRVLPPLDDYDWVWIQTDARDHASGCRRRPS